MSISIANTDASLSGKTVMTTATAETVTGLKTFDRDPNAPFAVSSGSAVVTNLDADKLDGKEGSAYVIYTDLTYTAPAFSAGDYTASAGTWTVASGDVTTLAYIVVGRMMTVWFTVIDTSVSTTPATLSLAIPASKTSTLRADNTCVIDENGTVVVGQCYVTAGGTTINFAKVSGNFSATTNETNISGQITFPIDA